MADMRHGRHIPFGANNFLSVLEGVEGGFAIFAGIIAGLMFEGVSRELLIISGAIGIIVSALNTSAVRFSSEHYLDELDGHEKRRWSHAYLFPALIEFVSYLAVSVVALIPLLLVRPLGLAVASCVALTIGILFLAGWYRGRLLNRRHASRDGMETAGLGALIVAVGALAGWLLGTLV